MSTTIRDAAGWLSDEVDTRDTGASSTTAPGNPPPWTVRVPVGGASREIEGAPPSLGRVVGQVALSAIVVLALITVVGSIIARRSAEHQGVHDAAAMTDLLATSVVQASLTDSVVSDPAAAEAAFARFAESIVAGPVVRVKLWSPEGVVLWSDEARVIGRLFELDDEASRALQRSETVAAVSDLSRPENVYERGGGPMLEVYRPVWAPSGEVLLFETYFRYSDVAARSDQLWKGFTGIMLSSMVALLALMAPVVWNLIQRARRAHRQREGALRRAADVSLTERRRIAGALHDGLVQDLVAASYVVAAEAQDAARRGHPEAARSLGDTATTVRSAIGGLRALLVDLYPPHLRDAGLAAAIRDVTTGSAVGSAAVAVAVDDEAVARLDADQQEAVFRVAQEAVRNAGRHARANCVSVTLRLVDGGDAVRLDVTDDGVGLPPDVLTTRPESFGRRLMSDQAERVGAGLAARSAPGRGTTIRMEVPVP